MKQLSTIKILALFIFLTPNQLASQNWFQDGDYWVYRYGDGQSGTAGFCEMTIAGDTIIDGMDAKIMSLRQKTFSLASNTGYESEFTRFAAEDYNIIYFSNGEGKLVEAFNFNLNEGNVYDFNRPEFQYECKENAILTIDSIRSFQIDGQELLIQFSSAVDSMFFNPYLYQRIYERIGSLDGRIFVPNIPCFLDGDSYTLCQFKTNQDSISFLDQDCYDVLSSVKEAFESKISLHPNPTNSTIYFNHSEPIQLIKIYDAKGLLIQQYENTNELDVSILQPGVYFASVFHDKNNQLLKFIKL